VARRGDVIALVGPNGAGKSTLIKTLLGDRPAASGTARIGGSVTPAWFRQDLADLPLDRSLYDCVADLRPLWTRGNIQNHLGAFGFSGDEVFRSTGSLSGGERARLALALLVLHKANLLVLDEPTNHLDVESIEAIEDALDEYEGTVLLVSHDRAVLREVATKVWAIDGDRLEAFDGPFVEWERVAAERAARRAAQAKDAEAGRRAKARADAKARDAQAADGAGRDATAARRAARRALADTEREVQRLERRVAELDAALADPALHDGSPDGARRAGELGRVLREARTDLDTAMAAWLAAQESAESLGVGSD
jgi:ATP-binding cassette subfamily F protein 3